jgi:hypothetical protein
LEEKNMAAKPYNGHHCWNCWNVSLWIANDEGLYRAALECKRRPHVETCRPISVGLAARRFLDVVGEGAKTPDGARYTVTAVRAALADLE